MTDVQARSTIASPHPPRNAQDKKSDNWVQCDRCQKWRRIPAEVDASKLPDNWFCDMNQWDDTHNSCSVSEENADSSPTLTALSSSGAIVWHGMPKCFLQTDDRRRFFATLIEFLQSTGQFHRLGRFPNVGKKPLDLYVLFLGVVRMGGMDQIIEKTGWRPISELFNFPPTTTSSGNSLMKNYRKYLYLFEKKFYREYSTGVTSLSNLRAANWNNDAVYEQISDPHSKSSPTSPAARARRKRKQEQKMSSGISVLEEAIAAEIKSSSKSPKMSGSKSPKSPSAANGRSLLSLSRHSPYVQPQPQLDSMDDDQDDPDEFDLDQHPSQFEDSEPHQPADDNSSDQEESGQSMRDRYGSASMMPSSSSSSSQVHMTHFASSSSSGYVPHLSSDSLHRLQVEEDEEEEAEYQRSVAKRQKAAAFGTSPRADPLLLRRILQSSAVPSPRLTSTSASAPSAAPWADSGALSLSSAFSMASAAAASFAGAVAAMPQVSSSPTPSLSPRSASPAQTPTLLRRGQPLHSRKTVNFSSTVHFRNDPRGGDAQGSTPSPFSNPEEPSPYSQGKSSPSSLVSSTSMTGRSGRADGMELIQLPANRISHLNLDQILQRLESRMNREDEVYRRVDSISQALARRIEGIRSQLPPIKTDIF